jgi:hypothetical protein
LGVLILGVCFTLRLSLLILGVCFERRKGIGFWAWGLLILGVDFFEIFWYFFEIFWYFGGILRVIGETEAGREDEQAGRASSGLALASAADRRARFLPPVTTLFCAILSLFGCVDFGHADLGTLRLGLLILGMCSECSVDWVC